MLEAKAFWPGTSTGIAGGFRNQREESEAFRKKEGKGFETITLIQRGGQKVRGRLDPGPGASKAISFPVGNAA